MNLEDHPTVRRLSGQGRRLDDPPSTEPVLESAWLRRLAMDCGADDAGEVDIARPGVDPQRDEILRNYPWTRSLLSIVVRMAREPVRGAPRSVAYLEFHRAGHQVNEICAAIVAAAHDGRGKGRAHRARCARSPNQDGGVRHDQTRSHGAGRCIVRGCGRSALSGFGHKRRRCGSMRRSSMRPTKLVSSSTTLAGPERADRAASGSCRAA